MNDTYAVDTSDAGPPEFDPWQPIVITGEVIDAEIERLMSIPATEGGRSSMFVHPRSTAPGLGLTPGIRVSLCVLLPGERTRAVRCNSTQVDFCIRGGGAAVVGGERIAFGRYDVFNTPSYRTHWYENDTSEVQVRLTYSNAPLLEKLHVHLVEADPSDRPSSSTGQEAKELTTREQSPFGLLPMGEEGAMLMPYEQLINPPTVESRALHWPWVAVKEQLDKLDELGESYVGRRLYLMYNPSTGRTNGTTPSFFATITIRPPGIVDRPHRHVSAAINYFFHGSGRSRVGGRMYEWKAGDLMFTAPGWMIHHHASDEGARVYELTIQDQPLHIAMESLLWQEDLKRDAVVLGSSAGFATNRAEVAQ